MGVMRSATPCGHILCKILRRCPHQALLLSRSLWQRVDVWGGGGIGGGAGGGNGEGLDPQCI